MSNALRLYVIDVKWPPETFIKRKLDALADAGIDVVVCSPSKKTSSPNSKLRFLRIYRPVRGTFFLSVAKLVERFVHYPAETRRMWEHIRSASTSNQSAFIYLLGTSFLIGSEPDVVHFEWNSAAIDFLPLFDTFQCPVTISCRGAQVNIAPHNPKRKSHTQGLRETFQKAAAIHCVSEDIKRNAIAHGADANKIWVIRPSVDPDFFFPLKTEKPNDAKFTIISTGSIIWRKGNEYALLAIRQLIESGIDVQYKLIGSGAELQRISYTIDDLELGSHVQILGNLPPEEVRNQLQRADAFLLSSLSEGISNAVLEAMACGLPVVTTDCGGMREVVSDGIEGFVVPVRDPDAIARAFTQLAKDPNLRHEMGIAGRERILRELTLTQQAERFTEMYMQLYPKRAI